MQLGPLIQSCFLRQDMIGEMLACITDVHISFATHSHMIHFISIETTCWINGTLHLELGAPRVNLGRFIYVNCTGVRYHHGGYDIIVSLWNTLV